MEMAECYVMEKNRELEQEVYQAFKDENGALDPQFVRKANGHSAVTVGFKSVHVKQRVIGSMENKFPGKLSWR